MEKEFVPYEQALALKELGFDEECFAYYYNKELSFGARVAYGEVIECPLKQQVFRWFREKHNLIGLVEGGYDDGKNIFTYIIWNDFKDDWCNEYVSTYEEAELECLKKLIEIVKNTSTSK
jgi:hypothetical protein